MTKVFAVASGSYSDYGIDAVFSTKKKAEDFRDWGNQFVEGAYQIEEWELDESWVKKPIIIVVEMDRDGNVKKTHREEFRKEYVNYPVGFIKHRQECYNCNKWVIVWGVKTDDEKRAIKVVNEKRTFAIANNVWGNAENMKELFQGGGG